MTFLLKKNYPLTDIIFLFYYHQDRGRKLWNIVFKMRLITY